VIVLHEGEEESHLLRGIGVAIVLSVPIWAGIAAAVRAVIR
jgi:hypothetical protein